MTNANIIALACLENGITEQVHTFAHWKTLGFQVRRGEHARFRTYIWKHAKHETESAETPQPRDYMFMKLSSFFGESQVEPIANTAH